MLLSQRIHRRKPSQRRIIMPCTVVIQIHPLLTIKLLTVVLVRLGIACIGKHPSEWIVMVRFLYRAALVNHNPVITLMVFQVVMILAVTQCHITIFGK